MRQIVARRRAAGDDGFSLVEVIVAMVIAVSSLLGLLTASLYSVRATVASRQNQQAANYLNQVVENARSLDYAALTMATADVPGTPADPLVGTSGGSYYFRPSTQQACTPVAGDTTCEKLDVQAVGSISQHVASMSTSNGTYTIKQYVSIPSAADVSTGTASERRLTVIASWSTYGHTHTRVLSTVITNTRRGLPLPRYTLVANGPAGTAQAKNPGNTVDVGLAITNLGARDSYTLTASSSSSPWTGSWVFYKDTDGDGVHDLDGTEPALTGGVTDVLDPGSATPFYVIAENTLNSTTTGTFSVVFSATSVANPTYAAKTLTDSVAVTAGAVSNPTPSASPTSSPTSTPTNCNPGTNTNVSGTVISAATGASVPNGSGTLTDVYFSNSGTNDSVTQATNTMSSSSAILQSTLCNYSTDQQTSQAGRLLAQNTSTNATYKSAVWTYTPASKTTYNGTGAIVLGLQCPSGTPTISFTLTQGTTTIGSGTVPVDSSCNSGSFKRFESTFTLANSSNATTTVTLTLTSANAPVRIAMGATGYESRLTMGLK